MVPVLVMLPEPDIVPLVQELAPARVRAPVALIAPPASEKPLKLKLAPAAAMVSVPAPSLTVPVVVPV